VCSDAPGSMHVCVYVCVRECVCACVCAYQANLNRSNTVMHARKEHETHWAVLYPFAQSHALRGEHGKCICGCGLGESGTPCTVLHVSILLHLSVGLFFSR